MEIEKDEAQEKKSKTLTQAKPLNDDRKMVCRNVIQFNSGLERSEANLLIPSMTDGELQAILDSESPGDLIKAAIKTYLPPHVIKAYLARTGKTE